MSLRRIGIESWGVRVAVEWSDPALDQPLEEMLVGPWKPTRSDTMLASYRFSRRPAGNPELHSPEGEVLLLTKADPGSSLERHLQLYVASHTRMAAFVHAGVVGVEGGALVIPGPSHSGKSSLVFALCQRGATYFSDEYAILDPQGRVHPHPRRLALRELGGAQKRLCPFQPGWRVGSEALPLRGVLLSPFVAEARWRPQSISRGEGALRLLENTVSAQLAPDLCLACLSRAVQSAECLESPRGEAEEAAWEILAYFAENLPLPTSRTFPTQPKGEA
ncbi:hypothetical protein IV102_19810 [bacterium]|nr:hypothetical protein [bacterium]